MGGTGSESEPDLSGAARGRVDEELRRLRSRRAELVDELTQGGDQGDRGDASRALEAGDELVDLDDRIALLRHHLADGGHPPVEGIRPGTRVTLRFGGGDVQVLDVVGITEEVPPGAEDRSLTTDSPLGLALSGARPGRLVEFDAPEGRRRVRVIDVELPE
ncbi:GreA/GreB family elongation factor [Saccharopolyspora sp. HNM0983]|uniref:GreA/GreB family elongation factor n=1 Tax=Saccharopolyspora montiporae TaxID=2781240 RepID=A0A929BBU6_9PSEU|nr:GreA/GreB family elongation factor [Saccharopolyspora sp. HNM0983]MBE9375976.1 GreA/GreB family elongation factor [Saccharopolyspora sp. HNM0983]